MYKSPGCLLVRSLFATWGGVVEFDGALEPALVARSTAVRRGSSTVGRRSSGSSPPDPSDLTPGARACVAASHQALKPEEADPRMRALTDPNRAISHSDDPPMTHLWPAARDTRASCRRSRFSFCCVFWFGSFAWFLMLTFDVLAAVPLFVLSRAALAPG